MAPLRPLLGDPRPLLEPGRGRGQVLRAGGDALQPRPPPLPKSSEEGWRGSTAPVVGAGGAPPSPGAPRLAEGMRRERARGRALCFPSWRWLFVRERPRGCALSHCPSPRPRSLFFSFWWVWAWCLLPPVPEGRGGSGGHDHGRGPWHAAPRGPPLTEALLEADSSSLLAGWAAFLRLRGLERVAFRRLFGGLVEESSYSSAREKRSLNLEGSGVRVRRCQGRRGHRDGRRRLTSSCGLRRSWPGRAAGPAGWGFG